MLLCLVVAAGCDAAGLNSPPPPAAASPAENSSDAPQVAEVGIGKKSLSVTSEGLVTTPVRALFIVEEKTVFKIQIPHTMNAFRALHGRAPRSHEEFMEKIIGNQIHLPELPEGRRYQYDPETEQLMVYPAEK